MGDLITLVNGKEALWTDEIRAKWDAAMAGSVDPKPVYHANYFTPRPYVDKYNSGSREEGFTYIRRAAGAYTGGSVYQIIIRRHVKVGGDE